ncbi:MAG: flagellar biosynthesis protein FlhF [Clostridium sp.]|nr:flagellar biosynthesis protein FlhF [Clostridium sp.]MDY3827778.1 flagellar biosynthesis protein FlhF [Clostridium sp.]
MIIKKYVVNNMNEALTRIRYELGRDAVIISQRKLKKSGFLGLFGSKKIEVTAAVENYSKNNNSRNEEKEKQADDDYKDSLENLKKLLNTEMTVKKQEEKKEVVEKKISEQDSLKSEMQEMKALLNKVIKNTTLDEEKQKDELLTLMTELDMDTEFYSDLKGIIGEENVIEKLKALINDNIEICSDELKGNVVLIGPTGVGKTTTIAKLAGRLSLIEKKKVGLITVDTYRIGAVEQLRTYAEIMNIKFKVVNTTKEMESAITELSDCDVVLIDTTGRSSKNKMQLSELRTFVDRAKADSISIVISATTKNKDIKTILDGYSDLNYDNVIITKLDETTTYGSLFNIMKRAQKPLRYITIGQNVPDDIKVPTKEEFIGYIFGEEKSLC